MVHTILCGPTSGFPPNLLPLEFYSPGILLTIAIKQKSNKSTYLKYNVKWDLDDFNAVAMWLLWSLSIKAILGGKLRDEIADCTDPSVTRTHRCNISQIEIIFSFPFLLTKCRND